MSELNPRVFEWMSIPKEVQLLPDNTGGPLAFTEIAVFCAKPVSFDANDKYLRVASSILSEAVSKFMMEWKDEFAFYKPLLGLAPTQDSDSKYRTRIYAKIYWVEKKHLEETCPKNTSRRKKS